MADFHKKKRFGGRDSDRRGSDRPRRERPDFDRFEKKPFEGKRSFEKRDFDRRGPEDREMHTATCDKCGKTCELPFKPRGGKPVYCSSCFRGVEYNEAKSANASSGELEQINRKLDMIMKALKIN